MLDHMIFNKLKWFNIGDNANEITANGKKWTSHPTSIVIADGTPLAGFDGPASLASGDNWYSLGQQTVKCLAKTGNSYAICGPIKVYRGNNVDDQYTYAFELAIVDKMNVPEPGNQSVISENWGVDASYLLSYQWLSMLSLRLRKERKHARSHAF